jgi:formylglycine-generating enzyme required for sulfatase activity
MPPKRLFLALAALLLLVSACNLPEAATPTSLPTLSLPDTATPPQPDKASPQPPDQPVPSATTAPLVDTPTAIILPTFTALPTDTPVPLPPTPTATRVLEAGVTQTASVDGMIQVYIPGGEFQMGSEQMSIRERPIHLVTVAAYWLDQTEVTNAMYAKCVQAGQCSPPVESSSVTRTRYYGVPEFANYPVIYVDWYQAGAYCAWAGRRLPTEAEWERAARGRFTGQDYPWGNAFDGRLANFCDQNCPMSDRANNKFNDGYADTAPVGSYTAFGFGLFDMAGNVVEWTSSLYQPYPYSATDGRETTSSLEHRAVRGGSWRGTQDEVSVAFRDTADPAEALMYIGFRCAATP